MKKFCAIFSLATSVFFTCLSAMAAETPPFTIEEFFKPPQLIGPTISRNGKYMAATMPFKGRMNLAVVDLEKRDITMLTGYDNFDVLDVTWVGNDRLLHTLGQFNSPTGPGQFDGGGLFMVGRDGKESRRISMTVRELRAQRRYVYRGLDFFRTIPGNVDEVIAEGNMTVAESQDLYRLNIKTGRHTLLTQGRPAL